MAQVVKSQSVQPLGEDLAPAPARNHAVEGAVVEGPAVLGGEDVAVPVEHALTKVGAESLAERAVEEDGPPAGSRLGLALDAHALDDLRRPVDEHGARPQVDMADPQRRRLPRRSPVKAASSTSSP